MMAMQMCWDRHCQLAPDLSRVPRALSRQQQGRMMGGDDNNRQLRGPTVLCVSEDLCPLKALQMVGISPRVTFGVCPSSVMCILRSTWAR